MDISKIMQKIEKDLVKHEVEERDMVENYMPRVARFRLITSTIHLALLMICAVGFIVNHWLFVDQSVFWFGLATLWSILLVAPVLEKALNDCYNTKLSKEKTELEVKKLGLKG